jgi:hypothetical protein
LVEWADLFANVLKQAEWNHQMVPEEYWNERVFEPFVLRLFALYAGSPGDYRQIPDRYAAVLAGWGSPKELSEALSATCDYHCDNMNDSRNEDWDPEFAEPPFDLIPWEVLAIREVRTRLGLPTPLPAHPLLATAEAFAPRGQLPADERLNAVERLRIALGMTVRE